MIEDCNKQFKYCIWIYGFFFPSSLLERISACAANALQFKTAQIVRFQCSTIVKKSCISIPFFYACKEWHFWRLPVSLIFDCVANRLIWDILTAKSDYLKQNRRLLSFDSWMIEFYTEHIGEDAIHALTIHPIN